MDVRSFDHYEFAGVGDSGLKDKIDVLTKPSAVDVSGARWEGQLCVPAVRPYWPGVRSVRVQRNPIGPTDVLSARQTMGTIRLLSQEVLTLDR